MHDAEAPPISPALARLLERVDALADRQVQFRRHLHRNPEPSGQEHETTAFVAAQLREAGLEPTTFDDVPGAFCDVDLGDVSPHTPRTALRGDMDALRLTERADVSFASGRDGLMHACGHDAHTSIALAAALAAADVRDDWDGPPVRLRFLFQPAEEDSRGARWLVERGAMNGVARVLGLHVDPHHPAGVTAFKDGPLTAFCDEIHLLITGEGAHAARPHEGRDPLAAACSLVTTLYSLIPRRYDLQRAAVLSFGSLRAGDTHNVIPGTAELRGTLRTFDGRVRDAILGTVRDACRGFESTWGVSVDPTFSHPLPGVVNDPDCSAALERAAVAVLGPDKTRRLTEPSLGGEDFAFYLPHAPGAMFRLGCATPDPTGSIEHAHPLHSPHFVLDERCLAIGSKVLLGAACG